MAEKRSSPIRSASWLPDLLRRNRSQRDPDAEEPESPRVVARVEDGRHPAAVVVERLVVEPALVQAAPGQVRRRRAPVSAVVVRATGASVTRPSGTARSSWTTWAARTTGPAMAVRPPWATRTVGPARSARSSRPAWVFGPSWASRATAFGPTRTAGTTWPTGALAVPEAARRSGLGGRHTRSRRQGGGSECDGEGRSAGQALDVHVQLPFGGHGYPTRGGYLANLCNRYVAIRRGLGAVRCARLTCASPVPTRPTRRDQRKFSRIPAGNRGPGRRNRCRTCQ